MPAIMMLRTYALYSADALVLVCLALILIAEMGLMSTAAYFMAGEFSLVSIVKSINRHYNLP